MKLTETAKVLSAHATELSALGAEAPASWLADLGSSMETLREFTMARLIEKCETPLRAAVSARSDCDESPTGAAVAKVVAGLASILKQAKEAKYSKDLLLLAQLIDSKSVYLETILQVLKDTMMPPAPNLDAIASKLKAAIGSDQFERLYSELAASTVDTNGLILIAKAVYGAKPKGSSRAAALAAIRKLHDVSTRTRRSLEAQGGRSAA